MGKALHDCIYVIKDEKEPQRYDKSSVHFLIDGANSHLTNNGDRPKDKVALSKSIFNLMSEYEKNGPTNQLINELTKFLEPVRYQCIIQRINRKLVTFHVAHLQHHPDPGILACYLFSNMVSLGWFENLKRCQSSECNKFFLGRSNVKWCSKTCGSRARVKKMRKKNKNYI
ncbi:MAG: CGNR zinc finger domain-containing protein [Bacteriovoracaceae bacterium]|jgi:hypothetical protein|nr:CGNR zinc finger domain-containing protein [Bacteriovoracaceae bacterium]